MCKCVSPAEVGQRSDHEVGIPTSAIRPRGGIGRVPREAADSTTRKEAAILQNVADQQKLTESAYAKTPWPGVVL